MFCQRIKVLVKYGKAEVLQGKPLDEDEEIIGLKFKRLINLVLAIQAVAARWNNKVIGDNQITRGHTYENKASEEYRRARG